MYYGELIEKFVNEAFGTSKSIAQKYFMRSEKEYLFYVTKKWDPTLNFFTKFRRSVFVKGSDLDDNILNAETFQDFFNNPQNHTEGDIIFSIRTLYGIAYLSDIRRFIFNSIFDPNPNRIELYKSDILEEVISYCELSEHIDPEIDNSPEILFGNTIIENVKPVVEFIYKDSLVPVFNFLFGHEIAHHKIYDFEKDEEMNEYFELSKMVYNNLKTSDDSSDIKEKVSWIEEIFADTLGFQLCCKVNPGELNFNSHPMNNSLYGITCSLAFLMVNKYYEKIKLGISSPNTHPDYRFRFNSLIEFFKLINRSNSVNYHKALEVTYDALNSLEDLNNILNK